MYQLSFKVLSFSHRYENFIKGGKDDDRFFERKQKSDCFLYHIYRVLEFMRDRHVLYDSWKIAQRRMVCCPELSGKINSKIEIHPLISHRPTRTDTDYFLGSNSPQLVVAKRKSRPAGLRCYRSYPHSPIPRQLYCGKPSLKGRSDTRRKRLRCASDIHSGGGSICNLDGFVKRLNFDFFAL